MTSNNTAAPRPPIDQGELAKTTIVLANQKTIDNFEAVGYEGCGQSRDKAEYHRLYEHWWNGRWLKSDRYKVWVLVRRGDEEAQDDPLSWMATTRKPVVFKNADGAISEEITYEVGPMITLKAKQGRGYATRLMQLAHYCLAHPHHLPSFPETWGEAPSLFLHPETRHSWLPYGQSALLTSGVGFKLYEGATIGDVPGTGFRFDNDEMNSAFNLPIDHNTPHADGDAEAAAAGWKAAWILKKDLDAYQVAVTQATANRLLADPKLKGSPALSHAASYAGCLERYESFAFFFGMKFGLPADSIAGVRYYPASSGDADGKAPEHKAEWPICLFWPGLNASRLVITHISRFPAELVPSLLAKWAEMAKQQGPECASAAGWGISPADPEVQAMVQKGMTILNRYETKMAPWASVWYGPSDGSKMDGSQRKWRQLEYWAWC